MFQKYSLSISWTWATCSFLGQYEALTLLKDLSVQADLARPPAQTLGQNLGELFDAESCCDIILIYQGHRIPAHRSVLMARCPYFRHVSHVSFFWKKKLAVCLHFFKVFTRSKEAACLAELAALGSKAYALFSQQLRVHISGTSGTFMEQDDI